MRKTWPWQPAGPWTARGRCRPPTIPARGGPRRPCACAWAWAPAPCRPVGRAAQAQQLVPAGAVALAPAAWSLIAAEASAQPLAEGYVQLLTVAAHALLPLAPEPPAAAPRAALEAYVPRAVYTRL